MDYGEDGLKLEVPFIELPTDGKRVKPVSKEAFLTLFNTHITYKIIANYKSTSNAEEILKDYKCNNRRVWMRADIGTVEMFKDNLHDTWAVRIEFKGCADNGPEWDFNDPGEAKKLYEALFDYFVTR